MGLCRQNLRESCPFVSDKFSWRHLSSMPPPSDSSDDEKNEERQSGKTDQDNPQRQGKIHAAESASDAEEELRQHNDFLEFDILRALFDKNRFVHNHLHDCFLS